MAFGCVEKDQELWEAQAAPKAATMPPNPWPIYHNIKPTTGFLFTSLFSCWLIISISLSFVNNVASCFEIIGPIVKICFKILSCYEIVDIDID